VHDLILGRCGHLENKEDAEFLISMSSPSSLVVFFTDPASANYDGSTLELTLQGTGQQPYNTKM
jgi:hypothetical protein